MNRNSPPEREPVEDQPIAVPELRHIVASLPPVVEEPERSLDQPEDGEPQHPEQHPRADPAGGRLAHEPPAVARVEREDDNHDDERDEVADAQEALEVARFVEQIGVEHGRGLDVREPQAVRDLGLPERPGRGAETGGDRYDAENEGGEGGSGHVPRGSSSTTGSGTSIAGGPL